MDLRDVSSDVEVNPEDLDGLDDSADEKYAQLFVFC